MNTLEIPTINEMNCIAPLFNTLPGRCAPYAMFAGEGERFQTGGQLVTVIARPEDTGGQFGAAWVFGGSGTETPFFVHRDEHRFIYVTEGRLRVWLPEETHLLAPGDCAVVPSGAAYAYRIEGRRTRFLSWFTGGRSLGWLEAIGRPTPAHAYDVTTDNGLSSMRATELADRYGIDVVDLEKRDLPGRVSGSLPAEVAPFVLAAGEGERWSSAGQLNTYLTRSRNTEGAYFAMSTVGAVSPFIPRHFHRLHTENFFCLQGRVLMNVNGEQIALTGGDFVHAPAGTIHSFAFDSQNTHMLGLLTTGVFEKFFEYMGTPTDSYVWDESGGEPPADGFARAMAELDLHVVGPPPERT